MSLLTDRLNIEYPIIQAPMLGTTTPAMVAAAANSGLLGSLPLGGLPPDKARTLIRQTKELTDKPFSVNLFAHPPAAVVNVEDVSHMQDLLAAICADNGVPFVRKDSSTFKFNYHDDLTDVILEEAIGLVSFTFGRLKADVIAAFKGAGITTIGTATSVAEARILECDGIDVIAAQGIEAGGHRGSFTDGPLPEVGLFSLLPQITDEVSIPVIAAGGIYDARTIKAALALGASAVQVGSPFILAEESLASTAYKEAVQNADDTSTVLTKAFSGRWARGIENELMRRVKSSGITIPYYTIQNMLLSGIRVYAQQHNITDMIALWAGQSAGKNKPGTTAAISGRLIDEYKKAMM